MKTKLGASCDQHSLSLATQPEGDTSHNETLPQASHVPLESATSYVHSVFSRILVCWLCAVSSKMVLHPAFCLSHVLSLSLSSGSFYRRWNNPPKTHASPCHSLTLFLSGASQGQEYWPLMAQADTITNICQGSLMDMFPTRHLILWGKK